VAFRQQDELAEAEDRVERCPELVADPGHDRGLGVAGTPVDLQHERQEAHQQQRAPFHQDPPPQGVSGVRQLLTESRGRLGLVEKSFSLEQILDLREEGSHLVDDNRIDAGDVSLVDRREQAMGGVRVAGIHELHLLDGGPVERVDGDPVDERGIEAACRQLKVQHVLVTRSEAILQPKRLFRLEQIVRGLEGGVEIAGAGDGARLLPPLLDRLGARNEIETLRRERREVVKSKLGRHDSEGERDHDRGRERGQHAPPQEAGGHTDGVRRQAPADNRDPGRGEFAGLQP